MSECELCLTAGPDVQRLLARFRHEPDGRQYAVLDRCRDAQACRDRVEQGGGVWELEDATKPTERAFYSTGPRFAIPLNHGAEMTPEADRWQ